MPSYAFGTFAYGTASYGSTALVDPSDPTTFPDLLSVGQVYEVGINGVGYMLADSPEDSQPGYRRTRVPLDPPRLVTQDTSFNDSFERYFHTAYSDFTLGAGQQFLERDNSSTSRYYDSDGVNPFRAGEVSLLHATALEIGSAFATPRSVVVNDVVYVQTGARLFRSDTSPGVAGPFFSVAAATTIESLATDGQRWYAAAGAQGIFRGTTADPGAAWSAVQGRVLGYAANRVCTAYRGAGSATANVFSTLNDAGAEEVRLGRITLPTGWTITGFTGGSGQVWFGAYSGNAGIVYRWSAGSTSSPAVAMELPFGQVPRSVFWYQGNVYVRADSVGGPAQGFIYRCTVDTSGNLTPFLVTDTLATVGSEPVFAGDSTRVYFSWPAMDGTTSGIGAIDITSGGYTKWFKSTTGGGSVRSVVVWQGRVGFTVDSVGLLLEQSTYLRSGTLTTSVSDRASSLDKRYDSVTLGCKKLLSGESIATALSFDNGVTFTDYPALTVNLSDTTRQSGPVNELAANIAMKFTLAGTGTTTPTLTLAQARQHVAGLGDTLWQLAVNCADDLTGLNDRPLPENTAGAGSRRARTMEGYLQMRVKFQDVDYPVTTTSEIVEVTAVDIRSTAVYDRRLGRNSLAQVAYVTLRKGAV